MASEVGICNSALSKIGAKNITALSEGSKNANVCNVQYAKLRDRLLRLHTWNFATARIKLARLSSTPAFEFDYEYQLPTGWLRTVSVHDNDQGLGLVSYKIEGLKVLTNTTEAYLRYIRRVEDPNDMSADFREALATMIARDIAIPIAQSNSLEEKMEARFLSAFRQAKSTDAIEDRSEQLPRGSWIEARE